MAHTLLNRSKRCFYPPGFLDLHWIRNFTNAGVYPSLKSFMEFTGVPLVNKSIQTSGVQFYNTSDVHCIVCSGLLAALVFLRTVCWRLGEKPFGHPSIHSLNHSFTQLIFSDYGPCFRYGVFFFNFFFSFFPFHNLGIIYWAKDSVIVNLLRNYYKGIL